MDKRIIALSLALSTASAFGPSAREEGFSSTASAQSAGTGVRMSCPEGGRLEEHLAPDATVHVDPGYAVSSHKARYVTRNGHVSIDICIMLRKFTEGEYAERQRVEVRGDTGVVYVYLQEKDLERVRR